MAAAVAANRLGPPRGAPAGTRPFEPSSPRLGSHASMRPGPAGAQPYPPQQQQPPLLRGANSAPAAGAGFGSHGHSNGLYPQAQQAVQAAPPPLPAGKHWRPCCGRHGFTSWASALSKAAVAAEAMPLWGQSDGSDTPSYYTRTNRVYCPDVSSGQAWGCGPCHDVWATMYCTFCSSRFTAGLRPSQYTLHSVIPG